MNAIHKAVKTDMGESTSAHSTEVYIAKAYKFDCFGIVY
jgi:hypothetical protein